LELGWWFGVGWVVDIVVGTQFVVDCCTEIEVELELVVVVERVGCCKIHSCIGMEFRIFRDCKIRHRFRCCNFVVGEWNCIEVVDCIVGQVVGIVFVVELVVELEVGLEPLEDDLR